MGDINIDDRTAQQIDKWISLLVASKAVDNITRHLYLKDPTAYVITSADKVLAWINEEELE